MIHADLRNKHYLGWIQFLRAQKTGAGSGFMAINCLGHTEI